MNRLNQCIFGICTFLLVMAIFGCSREEEPRSVDLFVAIEPMLWFVENLYPGEIDIEVMVPSGKSPATYDPTPRQLARLAQANLYFSLDMPFEEGILPSLRRSYPGLSIINTGKGIERRAIDSAIDLGDDHEKENDHHDHHDFSDPHIWLDPLAGIEIARTMAEALIEAYPEKRADIEENLGALELFLKDLNRELAGQLEEKRGTSFLTFHPSFGYFADRYGFVQLAVEVGGKEPSPKELETLLDQIGDEKIDVILIQQEFPSSTAMSIGRAIGAKAVTVNPLSSDYPETLRALAGAVGGE